jgi:hypothetical protein
MQHDQSRSYANRQQDTEHSVLNTTSVISHDVVSDLRMRLTPHRHPFSLYP